MQYYIGALDGRGRPLGRLADDGSWLTEDTPREQRRSPWLTHSLALARFMLAGVVATWPGALFVIRDARGTVVQCDERGERALRGNGVDPRW